MNVLLLETILKSRRIGKMDKLVLVSLALNGPTRVGELPKLLGLTDFNRLRHNVPHLVRMGWVERRDVQNNRVQPTPLGFKGRAKTWLSISPRFEEVLREQDRRSLPSPSVVATNETGVGESASAEGVVSRPFIFGSGVQDPDT